MVLREVAAVALAGAAGSLARYAVALATRRLWPGHGFPIATLAVNTLGAFLLALLVTATLDANTWPQWLKLALATGFLGAFTTFSTFAFETHTLLQQQHLLLAALNVTANLVLGLTATGLGVALARSLAH